MPRLLLVYEITQTTRPPGIYCRYVPFSADALLPANHPRDANFANSRIGWTDRDGAVKTFIDKLIRSKYRAVTNARVSSQQAPLAICRCESSPQPRYRLAG